MALSEGQVYVSTEKWYMPWKKGICDLTLFEATVSLSDPCWSWRGVATWLNTECQESKRVYGLSVFLYGKA